MAKGTGYFGRGRNIDAVVDKASAAKKPAKKKAAVKPAAAPRYRMNPKTKRYEEVK